IIILLFYSWHVRTKDNIARVRRDEAAAQEEERKKQDKLELAESEARINFLRRQSGLPEKTTAAAAATATTAAGATSEAAAHSSGAERGVDLFADYRSHVKQTNKDLEKEKKEEQEKYEKQIGYLTYLGQDTNEALKVRSWYEVAPKRSRPDDPDLDRNPTESHLKQKLSQDPLTLINALIPREKLPVAATVKRREPTPEPATVPAARTKRHKSEKKHHKKHKKHKRKHAKAEKLSKELAADAKRDKLDRLRKERLQREAAEQRRQQLLFAPKESAALPASAASTPAATPRIVQKYNSQFNPEIAKQNMM
ncbi:hypothetical protein KR222_009763, partial [Zaprionus bogoriensis]